MTLELVLVIGAITFASRAAAVVLLPPLPDRVREVLDRMPAALFAGLAAHSLVVPGSGLAPGHVLAAALGALIVAPRKSLPLCLVAGVLGYAAWELVLRQIFGAG
jgi:branched-subunit amino acid transport protein